MIIPNWMMRDTGASIDNIVMESVYKYAAVAGTGIALLAPNKYKTGGILMAAVAIGGLIFVVKKEA